LELELKGCKLALIKKPKTMRNRKPIIILAIAAAFVALSSFIFLKKGGVRTGDKAPDIQLVNPYEKTITLSSLKGKFVILDFWASWCIPCRRSNPELVSVYNKYVDKEFKNGKGLAVFSVSLDKNKGAWLEAIKTDGLVWQEHVCDFKGWDSPTAAQYGVDAIPSNFIIDGEGKVLGHNLHGEELTKLLDKNLK
jgi:thiol-disulfide isomerase/thioredoxin